MASKILQALRLATSELHTQAERSGIISDVLRGNATRHGYALLLRNLLPAYSEMENSLEHHRDLPSIQAIACRQVYRGTSLRADLESLCGPNWEAKLPLLPEARNYTQRISIVSKMDGNLLIGHAYARYLGDLNGGQILKRLVARSLGLEAPALNFYTFAEIDDLDVFKNDYRDRLDRAADGIIELKAIIDEAVEAFRLNISLSEAVRREAVALTDDSKFTSP